MPAIQTSLSVIFQCFSLQAPDRMAGQRPLPKILHFPLPPAPSPFTQSGGPDAARTAPPIEKISPPPLSFKSPHDVAILQLPFIFGLGFSSSISWLHVDGPPLPQHGQGRELVQLRWVTRESGLPAAATTRAH